MASYILQRQSLEDLFPLSLLLSLSSRTPLSAPISAPFFGEDHSPAGDGNHELEKIYLALRAEGPNVPGRHAGQWDNGQR